MVCWFNLDGFAAHYATGYATGVLQDLTGSDKAGVWAVGIVMVLGAALVVWSRASPPPDQDAHQDRLGEYPRSQPTG